MSEAALAARIETIERGYEYLLAYAAQGRQDDAGTELRGTLTSMHEALAGLTSVVHATFAGLPGASGAADFLAAVERDVAVARGAIGIVLSRRQIASLLVDNLNASVHLRALLTDLFLLEQAGKAAPSAS
ncbi:MAG TPA: hypothetical protein VNQ32_04405 [Steroidobacteraceae bacterium]|nr:hypothetical protein [Steroidobacteraceae bacterium]